MAGWGGGVLNGISGGGEGWIRLNAVGRWGTLGRLLSTHQRHSLRQIDRRKAVDGAASASPDRSPATSLSR